MASLIPKIKIGKASGKREKHNLSFDCSTTANIGTIQPTMCREMVPDSKFKVKVSSLVRLSSMPAPTFGRMSLRHYHTFVPYVDLWQPFDAMMSGQHYSEGQNNFIPTATPFFKFNSLITYIINYSDISICKANDIDHPYTITNSNVDWNGTVHETIAEAQDADLALINTIWGYLRQRSGVFGGQSSSPFFTQGVGSLKQEDIGVLRLGSYYAAVRSSDDTLAFNTPSYSAGNVYSVLGGSAITSDGADLVTTVTGSDGVTYAILYRFKAPLKRLRQIFIGLGYQFSPYNTEEMNGFKLLAYYKSWFSLFRPNRELTFVDTACYKLIKATSAVNNANYSTYESLWSQFIRSLMFDCYYYLPQDYYSMAVVKPGNGNQDTAFVMSSNSKAGIGTNGSTQLTTADEVTADNGGSFVDNSAVRMQSTGVTSPLNIKLAMKMLTWANKNTVIGRSIRQYLKVHFGVDDVNPIDSDAVYRIGSSRTNIQISDVMSTAENSQGYLGEYAGKGIGYGDSETFDFSTDKFGVWLTLTVIVPESGYYQGYLKENRHFNRYQFFNPEFDALGYQVLERGEIMDDYNCDNAAVWNPRTGFNRTAAFGFVPRYSEYKVGRNIVNGDLSLVSLYNSMACYFLDRRISAGIKTPVGTQVRPQYQIAAPSFIPSVVYDNFRRIDPSDHLGQYNRIFNVVTNSLDHFIIHNVFDVTAYAPMKSLSDSFDTVSKDDDGVMDVTHA